MGMITRRTPPRRIDWRAFLLLGTLTAASNAEPVSVTGKLPMNAVVTQRIQPQSEKLLVELARRGRDLKIDGVPVFNGSDKFLTGKIALGLVDFIADLPDGDPRLPGYLANFRTIAKLTVDDPNDSWGIYYYLTAIDHLKTAGRLDAAIDRLTLAKLRVRLDWRSFVDPDTYELIDHPNNYYAVALGIARLRAKLGWETGEASDRLFAKLSEHYRLYSGPYGFADETDGDGRFDRYSVLLAGEIAQRYLLTGGRPPAGVRAWLRKSADVMLERVNGEGHGFEYGRSIGPYGETSIVEVLTAAAAMGILNDDEMALAYGYASRAAEHYVNFWIDARTGSVNLWDDGRRTDAYRGKFRILGENLSLAHQFVYTNDWWNAHGYKDKAPSPVFDRLVRALPRRTVTWFARGEYDRLLVTMKDRGRLVSLPLINGAASQHNHSPYFPIPFSPGMLEGVADGELPLLVPQITLDDGSVLMPLAYFRGAKVETRGKTTIVTYDQSQLDRMGENAPVPDTRLTVRTRYEFSPGVIRRTDVFTPTEPLAVKGMTMTFGTFSEQPATDGTTTRFAEGAVRQFTVSGMPGCTTAAVEDDVRYHASIGAMKTSVTCTTGPRTIKGPLTTGWELRYQ